MAEEWTVDGLEGSRVISVWMGAISGRRMLNIGNEAISPEYLQLKGKET